MQSQIASIKEQQIATWQTQKRETERQLRSLGSEITKINQEQKNYIITAPVSGRLLNFSGIQKGNFLVQGVAIGEISPEESLGFNAKGVKGGVDALPEIPLPAIAHVIVKEQLHHFVVIYKVSKNKILVMDPAFGKMQEYALEDFAKIWTGVLILLEPNQYFEQKNEKTSLYGRFWNLVQPHKTILLQALIGAIIYTVLGLSTSIYIEKTLEEFKNQGKTMIIIAHRLSTIAKSDKILVMKQGKILEQGNHRELLSQNSFYKQMWEKQSISLK